MKASEQPSPPARNQEQVKYEPPEELSTPQEIIPESVLGLPLHFTDSGKAISLQASHEGRELTVNTTKFASQEHALRAACVEAGFVSEMQATLENNPQEFLKLEDKRFLAPALRMAGTKRIRRESPDAARRMSEVPFSGGSIAEEFEYACIQYILTGQIPPDVSSSVRNAMARIRSKSGKNALDFIASGQYTLERMMQYYEKYVFPILQELQQQEKEYRKTEYTEYVPPPSAGEDVELQEGDIDFRVEPFRGGYYRGLVYRYDPAQQKIVADVTEKSTFLSEHLPENLEGYEIYTFTGKIPSERNPDNVLPLPCEPGKKALPLPNTLTPAQDIQIMRDTRGTFFIEPKSDGKIIDPISFSFQFILCDTADNAFDIPPTEGDYEVLEGELASSTADHLATIPPHLTADNLATLHRIHTKKNLRYPESPEEQNEMNVRFEAAGEDVMREISDHGIANCHWGNIFAGQLCRRTSQAHRMPTGFFVQKDPRFDFAALAGIGHAWSEIWNETEWIRFDATPPKQKDEPDETESHDEEAAEGDYGENDDISSQEKLTLEEIEELFRELLDQSEDDTSVATEDPHIFEGIPLSKWRQVERFIEGVNRISVPKEMSISQKPSTLHDEWRALFDLIYQRREIPQATFRGPVRQSEGEELEDPVDACIDAKAGDDDPMGYKVAAEKTKEHVDITEFEDDVILDLTGSMKSSGAYLEQKKMVLSSLANIMALNKRLNLSYNKNRMRAPLLVRTRVASFKGTSTTQLHHGRKDEMNEKKLCELYDALDQTETGEGNLHGSLQQYFRSIPPELKEKLRQGKLTKVLTIVSDGAIGNQPQVISLIAQLRSLGIVVQGIGFGDGAENIRVICNDSNHPDSGVALTDVREATLARHKLLVRHLKKV